LKNFGVQDLPGEAQDAPKKKKKGRKKEEMERKRGKGRKDESHLVHSACSFVRFLRKTRYPGLESRKTGIRD
jgi:hypothetical protein